MFSLKYSIALYSLFSILIQIHSQEWLGPFIKEDNVNPILEPRNETQFFCPILQQSIKWENKDVFNPAAIVWKGQVHLLYRAEDTIGEFSGTSRIGHAVSNDGLHFERFTSPIFYPDDDTALIYEWPGGCEDPRIVQDENDTFVMTYTAYDGKLARLMVATSSDLQNWTKHGSIFRSASGGMYVDMWSKSGSIVTRFLGDSPDNMVAQAVRINGKFWMYWGDSLTPLKQKSMYMASSDDLINWEPLMDETGQDFLPIFGPRSGKFDSYLVEAGPQAIWTEEGTYLIYNSANGPHDQGGDPDIPVGTYSAGQIIFDPDIPYLVKNRTENYFMTPDRPYEIDEQVNFVVFLEGFVYYKGKSFLYYGTADSKIAVATMDGGII